MLHIVIQGWSQCVACSSGCAPAGVHCLQLRRRWTELDCQLLWWWRLRGWLRRWLQLGRRLLLRLWRGGQLPLQLWLLLRRRLPLRLLLLRRWLPLRLLLLRRRLPLWLLLRRRLPLQLRLLLRRRLPLWLLLRWRLPLQLWLLLR